MDLVEGTQNLMKFKKGETENEVTRKLNSMGGIEACSCEGLIPPKQWDFFSKRPSLIPTKVQGITHTKTIWGDNKKVQGSK